MTIGSTVMVAYPTKETTVTKKMKEFDGKITTIIKVRTLKVKQWSTPIYTLRGCKTEFGNDYEFLREWLVPLDEEVTE